MQPSVMLPKKERFGLSSSALSLSLQGDALHMVTLEFHLEHPAGHLVACSASASAVSKTIITHVTSCEAIHIHRPQM